MRETVDGTPTAPVPTIGVIMGEAMEKVAGTAVVTAAITAEDTVMAMVTATTVTIPVTDITVTSLQPA